jgi:hypothetical protein
MTTRVASLLLSRLTGGGHRGRVPAALCHVTWVTFLRAGWSVADSDGRLRSSADTRDLADTSGRCLHVADIGCTVDTGARRGPPKVPG